MQTLKKISSFAVLLTVFEWHMFGFDPRHTGRSPASFQSENLKIVWRFKPGKHIWEHTRRRSVWSASAVAGEIDGQVYVYAGSYDNNVYCLNARDGREVWRFATGGPVNAAPLFLRAKGRPLVIAFSADRIVYCLDARTGEKVWNYEIYPWGFTVFEGICASPVVSAGSDGTVQVVLGIWYADRKPLRSVQKGELVCLDGGTGKVIWRSVVSDSYILTPAIGEIDGKPRVYAGSFDGNVYCLDLADGKVIWKFSVAFPVSSPVLIAQIGDRQVVVAGTQFGELFCLDAQSGDAVWKYKTGMNIAYPGAAGEIDGRSVVCVPSYDRLLHCIDTATGKRIWGYETEKYIASCPVIFRAGGRDTVVFASLDNTLYMVDLRTGGLLWKNSLGERIWKFETRGETMWPSPIVAGNGDAPLLIVPWYDGMIYAFGSGR